MIFFNEFNTIILDGTDIATLTVQKSLYDMHIRDVEIFSNFADKPTFNIGFWPLVEVDEPVDEDDPDSEDFYLCKPGNIREALMRNASRVLIAWDGIETDTLSYLAEAIDEGKETVLFNDRTRQITEIYTIQDALCAVAAQPDPKYF